jgi:hypothetical protein
VIRQYDLHGRAIALGWAADQITVIDIDQGHSGASAADREAFRQLVAEVSLGRAGVVLGLESSRLAPQLRRLAPAPRALRDDRHAERANAQLKTGSRAAQDLAHPPQAPLLPLARRATRPRPSTYCRSAKHKQDGKSSLL